MVNRSSLRPPRRISASFAAAALLLPLLGGCDRGSRPENIGRPAPEFVVSDGTRTVDLAKLRGHIVLLNLWASWCAPCVAETPSLIALQEQLPNVIVVGISMDENDEAYRRFLDRYHVNFPTVRDPSARVNALYGTAQIPETYVIDQHGVLRRKFVSDQDWTSPEIVSYLKKLAS
jgi:cytochrome c biogenesis protein CcmG, thiol:disulfide interchange protein DsbE